MNSTFGIWLIGAGVVAVALLLLLGGPATERQATPEVEAASDSDVASTQTDEEATGYWQPVVVETAAPAPVAVSAPVPATVVAPCPSCGATARATTSPTMVGGCGSPSVPCGIPSCGTCRGRVAAAPNVPTPETTSVRMVGGCGHPVTPCGQTACSTAAWTCHGVCADPCRSVKPGINRNMPLCVDECSFIQLRSTVAHPICGQVRFEWSASRGWFLDPTASDPLFFAPTTQFCNGEDIWITLVVTDTAGAQYSDVISLHVRDLP